MAKKKLEMKDKKYVYSLKDLPYSFLTETSKTKFIFLGMKF